MTLGLLLALILAASEPTQVASTPFRTWRPLEFYLAEVEPSPGLIAAQVAGEDRTVYLHPKVEFDDRGITSASAVSGPHGERVIRITLTKTGATRMSELTAQHLHQVLAIAAGDKVLATPTITGRLTGETLDIEGSFSLEEAQALAKKLHRTKQ